LKIGLARRVVQKIKRPRAQFLANSSFCETVSNRLKSAQNSKLASKLRLSALTQSKTAGAK
jgi:hypothetical protein